MSVVNILLIKAAIFHARIKAVLVDELIKPKVVVTKPPKGKPFSYRAAAIVVALIVLGTGAYIYRIYSGQNVDQIKPMNIKELEMNPLISVELTAEEQKARAEYFANPPVPERLTPEETEQRNQLFRDAI